TTISGTFTADSAYSYVAIGNFYTDDSTTIVNVCPSCAQVPSEYLIDDVCVHKGELVNCDFNVDVPDINASRAFEIVNCYQEDNLSTLHVSMFSSHTGAFTINLWNVLGQKIYSSTHYLEQGKS